MGRGKQEERDITEEERKTLLKESQRVEESSLKTGDTRHNDSTSTAPPPPPDGGWGWVVLAASFLCNMVLDGIGYSFGFFVIPLQEHFGGVGKGEISLVGSILAGFIMLVGPISSLLVNKFGPRKTCIAGAFLSAISIFVSTFSPNVYMLMISYGVLGGMGLGLMYVPAVTAVGYWFEKKRSLVTGISTCGSGFGTIVFAPVCQMLLAKTDWQWTNRIIAGFCLLCTFLGLTMKPVPKPSTADDDSVTEMKKQNANIIKNGKPFNASKEELDFIDSNDESLKTQKPAAIITAETELKNENGYLTVLKNIPFFLVMLANLPAVMGLYIPYMFLPGMAKQRGISETEAALLISLIGFFNTGGRIVSGFIADLPRMDALFITFLGLLWGSFCPLLMTFCFDFWSYAIVCVMFGVSLSAWPALSSTMLVELLGLQLLTSAYGVLTCMRGAGAFLGPPFAGFIIDAAGPRNDLACSSNITLQAGDEMVTEDISTTMAPDTDCDTAHYEVAFYISSLLLAVAAVGHAFAFCVKKVRQQRRERAFAQA